MSERAGAGFVAGLEDVVAVRTCLSGVDGGAGKLVIGGFTVEELAGNASFEETVYLLWNGELPDAGELAAFREALAARRRLPRAVLDLLRSAASEKAPEMDALRMAVGTVRAGRTEWSFRAMSSTKTRSRWWRDSRLSWRRTSVCWKGKSRSNRGRNWGTPRTTCTCSPGRSRERRQSARSRRTSTPSWTTG